MKLVETPNFYQMMANPNHKLQNHLSPKCNDRYSKLLPNGNSRSNMPNSSPKNAKWITLKQVEPKWHIPHANMITKNCIGSEFNPKV